MRLCGAFCADAAVMQLHDPAHDGKPKAAAFFPAGGIRLIEPVKCPGKILLIHAAARIRHGNDVLIRRFR